MFPSSGLFADINCPFAKRGLCERPHCLYRHAAESWDTFGGLFKSSIVDLTGDQYDGPYAACGGPVNDETTDDCLHELERINKEIETVKHEVEQEQRRLSCYQTVQADTRNGTPASKHETSGSYGMSSSTDHKTLVRSRKYVVDNSKPRTDLEYDPLSNFSAALRSYKSSSKQQKVKNQEDLKRSRPLHYDQKEPTTYLAPISRSPSPEPLHDSNEDGVLIIDVPSSPEKPTSQSQIPLDSVANEFSQDTVREAKMLKLKNADMLSVTSSSALRDDADKGSKYFGVENYQYLATFADEKEYKNAPLDENVVDLTGYLEELESGCENSGFQFSEAEKIPEPESVSTTSAWCEPSTSVEKMNLPPMKNMLFYKAPTANSPPVQHSKQAPTTEPHSQSRVHSHWPPVTSVQSPEQNSLTMLLEKPGQKQGKATVGHISCLRYQKRAEPPPGRSQFPANVSSSINPHLRSTAEQSDPTEQLLKAENEMVIIINSSPDEEEEEEEELNYSEMEVSDSDPMEECYRIFMESNNESKGNEEHPDVSVGTSMDVEKPEVNATLQPLSGKKRVAHEAKHMEPLAKSRPQPQVLVPLREPAASGFGSRPPITSKIQQIQQRASMLTASVKASHAFVSSTVQKKPETQSVASALTQPLENLKPAPIQNAYLNYIPIGTAVIEVGNSLHLILPQGSFPVTSTCSPATSVLTPISQVHPSPVQIKQTYHPATVTPLPRYRSTAPVLIAAPPRRPALNSAFASTSLHTTAASTAPQAPVLPMPVKRKLRQQCEAPKDKVPHDVRQRYVNMFTEEFLKTSVNVNEAFEKALAEEKTIYNRSVNKLKYLSVAVNALKRLKNQSSAATKNEKEVSSQRSRGNVPLNPKNMKGNDDRELFESLQDYVLSDEKMIESNYPVQHPEKRGCAVLFIDKKVNTDPLKRICCRCGATYSVSQTGKHIRKEECNYHYGKGVENRVPGGVETRYSCCQGVMGAPGCQVFKLHVHDSLSLDGFVSTASRRPSDKSCPGVYSLACEMCYTIHGLELSRVTVVSSNLKVIYDTFVKPDNEVIDLNTRFSCIGEEDVKGNHTSLREVQQTLLSFISADTILVGHGLETDLCLLKLLHGMVVDTSVVFPHRLGLPHKLSLNNLTAEYLRRIIQESVCGHDTAEDAAACMELMLWRLKEDGKLKK
ncbi:uncharacterized protein LOC142382721 [Odontesthes bonariensis]|uniref:uncharacterized protein LOC142382721 n=1 Tax=Odontesthes bonariensis TaxID=219752 RepID=UPI003F58AF0E